VQSAFEVKLFQRFPVKQFSARAHETVRFAVLVKKCKNSHTGREGGVLRVLINVMRCAVSPSRKP
jgi:hypothetical protein